jgi:hypothetical protein
MILTRRNLIIYDSNSPLIEPLSPKAIPFIRPDFRRIEIAKYY